MTARITSEQEKQFNRFVEDAISKARKEVDPDKDGLQRLIERGGEFQAYVVAGIARFAAKAPDYDLARTILGKDFISPEDIMKSRRGFIYTDDQLAQYGDTVPSQEVLEWCRDNDYMLVAGPNRPMSLLDVRDLKRDHFYSKEGGWYAEQKFAENDKVDTRWVMLRKGPVLNSTSKNWNEQQTLLSETEVTPNVAGVAWCVTTYKAVRNVYLLPGVYVRTSSLDSDGVRVSVGSFDARGLRVSGGWGGRRGDGLGLASSRKTET
ncbi:MAG: hypothetical protein PHV99_02355 [Candidatus Pacebacteria bacterium]|nr:hypothetical protein [Candidatus Paceibacterota bacterium]